MPSIFYLFWGIKGLCRSSWLLIMFTNMVVIKPLGLDRFDQTTSESFLGNKQTNLKSQIVL